MEAINTTASWAEIHWTFATTVGFLVAIYSLREAWYDSRAVRQWAEGETLFRVSIRAFGNIRREAQKVVLLLACMIVGLMAMNTPPSNGVSSFEVVAWLFVFIGYGLAINSVWDLLDRRKLLESVRRQQDNKELNDH